MDVTTMIKREPFYEILGETIEQYYIMVFNEQISFLNSKKADATKVYFYFVPSFLSTLPIKREMRDFLYSEYNIRGSKIKYLLGKLAVFAVTHSAGMIAKKKFYISSGTEKLNGILISPCNRSIRFYDFNNGYVDCIVKSRYSNGYMQNQLQYRLKCKYHFVPKIKKYGERWYREEIMYGNPLIRVIDDNVYYHAQETALKYMGIIARDTLKNIPIGEYIVKLKEKFDNVLAFFSNENSFLLSKMGEALFDSVYMKMEGVSLNIPTAETHGDFQGGNIWVNKQQEVIIYDWETVKRRSIWFDPATLLWKLHARPFISGLLNFVLDDERFLINDDKKKYDISQKKLIACVLYLENILFYLDDLAQLPMAYSEDNCKNYIELLRVDLIRKKVIHE
ncbi:hypothetical protein ACG0Z4_21910 [Enterocloster aldenensis]|uniref:hypothetical protein n=1 Tax=Enterocloster aldenensis TaxID=358742 RepID=UPI0040283E01